MGKRLLAKQLELGRQGVQAHVIEAYETVGCRVERVAQSYRRGARRNPGTPGLPDLYVFPPLRFLQRDQTLTTYPHRFLNGPGLPLQPWWHETKSEGGRQSKDQADFQQLCAARVVGYVLGGVTAAVAHMRKVGLVA